MSDVLTAAIPSLVPHKADMRSFRVMRRTGRLYNLTLFSCLLTVLAATLVAMWDESSSALHLWLDVVPQGFGMASVITTTLIVRILPYVWQLLVPSPRRGRLTRTSPRR